jgi:hypothetical protein
MYYSLLRSTAEILPSHVAGDPNELMLGAVPSSFETEVVSLTTTGIKPEKVMEVVPADNSLLSLVKSYPSKFLEVS